MMLQNIIAQQQSIKIKKEKNLWIIMNTIAETFQKLKRNEIE